MKLAFFFLLVLQSAEGCANNWEYPRPSHAKVSGSCLMHIDLCSGFYDWQWRYDSTVTDVSPRGATGMQGNAQHYDSKNGAIQHSVWELFQKLTMTNETADCNCRVVELPERQNR
jgi:hypothetical protein